MKILLGGVPLGCDNVGDEAIITCVVQLLREIVPEAELTVSTREEKKTARLLNVRTVPLYGFPPDIAVAVVVGSDPVPAAGGDFWFCVPKGAKSFGFFASTSRGRICGPDGNALFDLAKKNGHFSLDVSSGADGCFWSVRNLDGRFRPMTAPAVLNANPRKCLVPKGTNGF